jgi:hypothetical protein
VTERLLTLWTSVMEAQGFVIEGVSKNRLIEMARKTELPREEVVAAIEADEWLKDSFDMSRL